MRWAARLFAPAAGLASFVLASLVFGIAFAPALAASLAVAPPWGDLDAGTIQIRVSGCCAVMLPPMVAAWARFLASTLHMSAGWISAAVAVAFGVQSVVLCYLLFVMNYWGGARSRSSGPAAHPFRTVLDVFCTFALSLIGFSLPLALIAAVIGLLT